MKYEPVIGLEVHAQLLTQSKLFCSCSTLFGDEPNTNICPICTGQPGTLPVLNKKAVEFAVRAGLALNCTIEKTSVFSRKNYFYPDLPKGYQISQYDKPLCLNGHLDIDLCCGKIKRIGIVRIHMEEDSGKLVHDFGDPNSSHVDYNRSSVALIEIVSAPDIASPSEGVLYLKALRSVLMYLEVCDGNMQEGSFRCDANISVKPIGEVKLGTRTEIKNLNSFKAIEQALNYEIERQSTVLSSGGMVVQETLLWDDSSNKTLSMRGKEEAHDYRYFPEPDLPPLVVDEKWVDDIKASLPELSNARAKRFVADFGIPEYDAAILTQDKAMANFYESCVKHYNSPKKIANWIISSLLRELNNSDIDISDSKITPQHLARLVELIDTDAISGKIGKIVFEEMCRGGKPPDEIVKEKGLIQVADSGELEGVIDGILKNNADNVAKYKSGKTGVFGFFVGEVMKSTKGKANPKMVNDILKRKLI